MNQCENLKMNHNNTKEEENTEYNDIYNEVFNHKKTYEIIYDNGQNQIGIKCLKCSLTSYSVDDIQHRYCAKCKIFHRQL